TIGLPRGSGGWLCGDATNQGIPVEGRRRVGRHRVEGLAGNTFLARPTSFTVLACGPGEPSITGLPLSGKVRASSARKLAGAGFGSCLSPGTLEPPDALRKSSMHDASNPWQDGNLEMDGRPTKRHDASDSAGPPLRPCEAKEGVKSGLII